MKLFILSLLLLSLTGNSSALFKNIFGNLFPTKHQCPIKLYDPKDSSFTGVKLYANAETFHPLLHTLSTYAKKCHVKINVKQAFVQEKSTMHKRTSSVRTPLVFQVGEAIEFELLDEDNTLLCNRLCMKKSLSQLKRLPHAKCFLRKLSRDHDLQRDFLKPTIVMKRRKSNETLFTIDDQRKDLQNKCKKLDLL